MAKHGLEAVGRHYLHNAILPGQVEGQRQLAAGLHDYLVLKLVHLFLECGQFGAKLYQDIDTDTGMW